MASTIIDSLIVELSLDSSKYEVAQKRSIESLDKFDKTSQKTNKTQLDGSKKLAEGFAKATSSLVGFATAAVGANGFKNFVATMVTGNAELGRNAKLMGMSAQQITAWGSVLQGVGGKAEDFVGSIQNIKGAIARLRTGTGGQQILAPMNMLGLDLKSVEDPLKLAQAFQRYSKSNGMEAALARAQDLGVNQNTFMAMMRTDKSGKFTVNNDYKAALATAEATKKDTDAAEDLAKKWSTFGAKIDAIKQSLLREFMPTLDKVLDKALLMAGGFEKLDDKSKAWLVTLTAIGAILGTKIFTKAVLGLLGLGGAGAAAGGGGVAAGTVAAEVAGGAATGWMAKLGFDKLFTRGGAGTLGELTSEFATKRGTTFLGALGTAAKIGGVGITAATWTAGAGAGEDEELARLRGIGAAMRGKKDFSATERKYGLPAGFLDAQWMAESRRGKQMLSPVGAMGHFQFMPGTLKEVGLTKEGAYDLDKSSEAAGLYISRLKKRYGGDMTKATAAYNFGMGNLDKTIDRFGADYMQHVPRETQDYVSKIMRQTEINQGSARRNNGASSSEVNIGTITVNTQATDANAMAKDVKTAFRNNSLTAASVGGAQ